MSKTLLTDTEACIYLGITKELLYAYVRNAPKKHLGHNRKLVTEFVERKNMFDKTELDSFDSYLKEPWSEQGERRPAIPKYIKEYLKTEIGGKCPITQKGYPLEDSHLLDYSISRSHHHHNIIRVAKDEHTKYDNGILPKEIFQQAKERLVASLRERLKAELGMSSLSTSTPNPHPLFIGREKKLKELLSAMESERLIVIEGIGGVGKTQLLLNAFNNVTYHNPVVWVNIESINTLEDLHILISNEVSKILGSPVANSLLESLSIIQATFVFDGLEYLLIPFRDKIEDWVYQIMTRTSNIQLLITSQIDISIFDQQKVVIKMKGINKESSKRLLKSIIHSNILLSDSELEWVLDFCNGHPLSLKLTSSIINFYKEFGKAKQHLKKEDSLKQPLRKEHNKSNALTACLNTVYSILDKNQLKILHLTKFFPAGVKQEWAKSMLELDNYDYEIAILQQFFMIDIEVDLLKMERIIVYNPLRKFLHDRSKKESLDQYYEYEKELFLAISIEAMLVDHKYIETSSEGSAEYGILRMESELPNVMEVFNSCKFKLEKKESSLPEKLKEEYKIIIGNISSALGKYFFVRGFYEPGVNMAMEGISRSLELEMYESAAIQYVYLSQLQSRKFDFDGVQKTIKLMDELLSKTNDNYVLLANHWMKGRYLVNLNKNHQALEHFSIVEKLMEERITKFKKEGIHPYSKEITDKIKYNEVGNLGLVFSEIANIYQSEGNYLLALDYFKKGLRILEELKDDVNIFNVYYGMANCYVELDQLDEAIKNYFTCVEGFSSQGNYEYLSNTLAELGRNVDLDLSIGKNSLLTTEVFEKVFSNFNFRLNNILSKFREKERTQLVDNKTIPFELIGQMFLLVQLTSFSKHPNLLYDWAIVFQEKFHLKSSEINYFSAIINLAHAIGSFDYWSKLPEEEKKPPIETILISCIIINGGLDINSKTRVFYWLAEWFKYTKLDKDATAENLRKRAYVVMNN